MTSNKPLERLTCQPGTKDQLYMALRLAFITSKDVVPLLSLLMTVGCITTLHVKAISATLAIIASPYSSYITNL